jgi:hypothetical protein
MNRLLLAGVLALACVAGACSGGGIPVAPPPTGGFSNASLKGNYAFLMSGTSASTGDPFSRIGSFIADGNGGITMAVEDANDAGTVNTVPFLGAPSSSYSVQSNGQGTLILAVSPTSTLSFSFSLSTSSFGYIIQTDGSSTVSGYFQLQTLANAFSPSYAFDFSGIDINQGSANFSASASLVGQFTTNGTTGVTGGLIDINDGAALTSTTIGTAGIGPDPTYGATFGRGTFVVDGLQFIYYMIDQQHLLCIEGTDGQFATVGSATAQSSVPTTTAQLAGSFVFIVGGATGGTGPAGPITRAARFTSDATGALTNVFLDQNFSGTHKTFPGSTITNAALTIDPAGSGRGTLTFTDSSTSVVFKYIFYLSSATSGFIQDVGNNDILDGSLSLQQAGPFALSSQAGNYIVNWSGFNGNNSFEEDFVGQFALSTSTTNNITGATDYAELGNNQVITGAALTGTLTITGDGTLGGAKANTAAIAAGNQSFGFNAYILDSNNIVLIGTDSTRVVLGTATRQP